VNLLALAIFGIYVLHKYRDKFLKFISLAVIPLIFLLWYNYYYFGSPFTSGKSFLYGKQRLWKNNFLEGFFGQLISPSGGLFVYSPILIFSLYGIYSSWKERKLLLWYSTIAILNLLAFYSNFKIWYGGHSWGPRYLNDVLPCFSLLLVPSIERIDKRKKAKVVFVLLSILSVFVQLEGVLFFNGDWHAKYGITPYDHSFLWSLENTQIVYYLKNPNADTLISYDYVLYNLIGKKVFYPYYSCSYRDGTCRVSCLPNEIDIGAFNCPKDGITGRQTCCKRV
jgi:hypothetical protein